VQVGRVVTSVWLLLLLLLGEVTSQFVGVEWRLAVLLGDVVGGGKEFVQEDESSIVVGSVLYA
jgi:hypothetical protein